jgi:hypothetical protein
MTGNYVSTSKSLFSIYIHVRRVVNEPAGLKVPLS